MTSWEDLLRHLAEAPRENGTAALQEAADYLFATLTAAGLHVERFEYLGQPLRLRLAGVLALLAGSAYFFLMRAGRARAALATALLLPGLLLAVLDYYVPLPGRLGMTPQSHVVARIDAREAPTQRLLLAAHYDTKTDLLDHVQRAPLELATIPLILLLVVGAVCLRVLRRRAGRSGSPRLRRVASIATWAGPVAGTAYFLTLTAGAFVPGRSPGAIDDGAACAILVRLAQSLAAAPLAQTEVELLFLSGEEAGVHGSWVYAESQFSRPPDLPTALINLELVGASANLAVFGTERFTLRSFRPDARLVALLDELHRRQRGQPLYVFPYPAATDARSFMAHGIPAATLASDLDGHAFIRGMHSTRDSRERLAPSALDSTLELLLAAVRAADERALLR